MLGWSCRDGRERRRVRKENRRVVFEDEHYRKMIKTSLRRFGKLSKTLSILKKKGSGCYFCVNLFLNKALVISKLSN
jgi:hypothetical protein